MKSKTLLLSVFLFLASFSVFADEGDTLIIQTIDWDTPPLPGWNSPRSGTYQFPGDTVSFSKILMYYTLKCDPSQNPACGEWDYTTHTHIREHTGVYDSNLYTHPNYLVNDASPDSFMFMDDESFRYKSWKEFSNQTAATNVATIGTGGQSIIFKDDNAAKDGKLQHIYRASELIAGGLQEGDITGLIYNFIASNVSFDHYTIRMKNIGTDTLPPNRFEMDDLTTVFDQNKSFVSGAQKIDFAFPFNWDGTSNILFEISYTHQTGDAEFEADAVGSKSARFAIEPDFALNFEGWDYITVPAEVFNTIDSAITISFWQFGNPEYQPQNSSIIEGVDSAGHRVLNIHLPWSNEIVYWDAGWDDGYDRLDLKVNSEEDYMGKWNHWAFTKDLESGLMMVFLNGELFNIGGIFSRPMSGITEFRIASGLSYNGYYAGMIDEFRVWDAALDIETIQNWMYRDVDQNHPDYEHLRVYYQFNEGSGFEVEDSSPNNFDGDQFGYPAWISYNGKNRFRNADGMNTRPHLILENGNYDAALLDSVIQVDTFAKAPVNIVTFDPDNPPVPLDTLTKWPAYYNDYVYDENGIAVDSTLVPPDGIFYHEEYEYYGEPYEIIVPWEIGRFITPYGINLSLGDGWTWVYDVTDYAPMLRDSVHLTAGNFQELLDLKFYMIEGTPPREVKKIEKVYSGYYYLNQFPEVVPPDTIPLLADATNFKLKTRTSGHLFDNPTNCAEFCPKIHSVVVNDELVYDWQIIEECSDNPLYPQGGTWIYDRAGWCPGAKVTEHDIEITPYISGDEVIVDYNSAPDQYGAYSLEVQMFSYGNPNFNNDAAVDEVIAPNNLEVYSRFNPTATNPIVVIQNRGGSPLNKVTITYGPQGSSKEFTWTGELDIMEKEEVILEPFSWAEWVEGNGVFNVSLSNPNNEVDENPVNDSYHTNYNLPTSYPGTFIIRFKTNKRPEQNGYQIFNAEGEVVHEKSDFEPLTLYRDTITLVNGIYDFYLWDSGDNGISFWANDEGSGYIRFYDFDGNKITDFEPDFGDRIYHSFYMDMYLGTNDPAQGKIAFNILPNPNSGQFTISYALKNEDDLKISLFNTSGQQVWTTLVKGSLHDKIRVNIADKPAGIYTCVFESNGVSLSKKFIIK